MKKKLFMIFVNIFLFIFAFSLYFYFRNNLSYRDNIFLIIGFLILLTVLLLLVYKYPRGKNYISGYAIRIIIISILSALITLYLSGIFLGFARSSYSITLTNIVRYSYPIVIISVLEEIIRYIICKNTTKKIFIVSLTIFLISINIYFYAINYRFINDETVFIFISTIVFSIIARESLYSYITYKIGITSTLILRLCLELYSYVFPIYPDLGNYLQAVVSTLFPFIVYRLLVNMVDYAEKVKKYVKSVGLKILYVPIIMFLLVLIILVSGMFNYKMIAISSGSMYPIYDRGDAVIFEKVSLDTIEVGDILAYRNNGVIITHRVIYKSNNGKNIIFKTKGDANNTDDKILIDSKDVLGVVKYKVPKIGYPTVWINEKFKNLK